MYSTKDCRWKFVHILFSKYGGIMNIKLTFDLIVVSVGCMVQCEGFFVHFHARNNWLVSLTRRKTTIWKWCYSWLGFLKRKTRCMLKMLKGNNSHWKFYKHKKNNLTILSFFLWECQYYRICAWLEWWILIIPVFAKKQVWRFI